MKGILSIFCHIIVCLGSYTKSSNYDFLLAEMKYFRKQEWRTWSDLKRYESENNIRNYVGKCKNLRKRKENVLSKK